VPCAYIPVRIYECTQIYYLYIRIYVHILQRIYVCGCFIYRIL
jgi:hypothetical protein